MGRRAFEETEMVASHWRANDKKRDESAMSLPARLQYPFAGRSTRHSFRTNRDIGLSSGTGRGQEHTNGPAEVVAKLQAAVGRVFVFDETQAGEVEWQPG
jgi:hypothetical protein